MFKVDEFESGMEGGEVDDLENDREQRESQDEDEF